MRKTELRAENYCFGCGGGNAHGLRLIFDVDDAVPRAIGHFRLAREFQGAEGVVHGGVVAAILDEAMGKLHHGVKAMTAHLVIEYRRPVPVGEEIIVEAVQKERKGRNLLHSGEIRNAAGEVLARGEARFVELDEARLKKLAEENAARAAKS
jgi:acyl-coenzyme A thioesterase PaaI-like protein